MKRLLALGFVLGLAGCKDDSPPHWSQQCVASHSETSWVYWPASGGGIGLTPYGVGFHVGGGLHLVSRNVCDRYEPVCVPAGKDYKGDRSCQ